jgi:pimeloyl-ACP methyl ester carboxylesterase
MKPPISLFAGSFPVWRAALLATSMATGLSTGACLPSFYANKLPGTPADATFVDIDGVSLHYKRIAKRNSESSAANGNTVVLIHGFGASLESWTAVQEAVSEDHDVIAFDLKGFGWSTRPDGDYSPAEQARLIWRALAKLGITNTMLIGHSWGASVVLAMTLQSPAKVARLGLISAYVYDEQVPSFFRWSQLPGFGEMLFAMFYNQRVEERVPLAYYDINYATQKRVDVVEAEMARPGATAAALAAARGHHFSSMSAQYGDLKMPALLLWGQEDQVTPLHFGQRLQRQMANANLQVLPKCGHMPMIEARTQTVAAIRNFLAAEQPIAQVVAPANVAQPDSTAKPESANPSAP